MHARSPLLGGVAVTSVGTAVVLGGYLHLVANGRVSPVHDTVSDYVHTIAGASAFVVMCLAVAIGSLALTVAVCTVRPLLHDDRRRQLVAVLLGTWCLGLAVAAIFPTDPVGAGLSLDGELHRWAIVVAFTSLPCAAWSLSRPVGPPHAWSEHARSIRGLSAVSFAGIGVMLLSYAPVVFDALDGLPVVIGATERLLLAIDLVLLVVLARPLLSRVPARAAVPDGAPGTASRTPLVLAPAPEPAGRRREPEAAA